ncbi:putative toxin [Pseudopedobacter beijingensis]|uniref:Toxin n=1 Tax=Pseudopedobacter beijingensis TaxID=1207056 RepID=A0ABW4IE71_9SPHI
MGSSSYSYDAIGNLTGDTQAGISHIDWTVYGKIKGISRAGGNIAYGYDAGGNRISKTIGSTSTYYVRDAQGNPLAVYENVGGTTPTITWKEQQLYGSSRLGMWKPDVNLAEANGSSVWGNTGQKFFELGNHLGNVMAVITDKRNPVSGGGYEAEVVNAQDYYAFGSIMPGRSFSLNSSSYRYGFNGKENDNEVKGEGNQQDYGMRIHDTRLGRFLSVDPVTDEYPELTPYQFASNRPLDGIDRDGLEWWSAALTFSRSSAVPRPVIETVTEASRLPNPGTTPKTRPSFSPEQLENFRRGNQIEAEQLAKHGYEKNTKPFDVEIEPGNIKRTIPDALKEGGKQTSEIKNVKRQSMTDQLRAQRKISNDNGFKPELIINKTAKISKTVKNAFDIKYYQQVVVPDNTRVAPSVDPSKIQPKDPCNGNPNCL